MPFGTNSVWFVPNGDPARFVVMNKTSGDVKREFVLPAKIRRAFTVISVITSE